MERPEVPSHVKSALFHLLLQQAEDKAKKVVLGSGVNVGEEVMPTEDVLSSQRKREDQHRKHQVKIEKLAMTRTQPELETNGAFHLKPDPSSLGSRSAAGGENLQHHPEWRLLEPNDWRKRQLALGRFVGAVNAIIFQQRRARRLSKMKDFLSQVGFDKNRLAEETANPVLLAQESDRPGTAPAKHLKPDMVRTRPLPLYRDVNFYHHHPVEISHYTDFDELGPMQGKPPLVFKSLGYEPEPYPGLTPYAPSLLDQPLLQGALEESIPGSRQCPSGLIKTSKTAEGASSDAPLTMPDACKQMPFISLEVANRYSDDKAYASTHKPSWGVDEAHAIQPRLYPFHDSTANDATGSGEAQISNEDHRD